MFFRVMDTNNRTLFCCVTMIAKGIYLHKENSKKMNAM